MRRLTPGFLTSLPQDLARIPHRRGSPRGEEGRRGRGCNRGAYEAGTRRGEGPPFGGSPRTPLRGMARPPLPGSRLFHVPPRKFLFSRSGPSRWSSAWLPFLGVNRRLILALSLRPWCLARKAASPFVRVSFTVTVPAVPALALARESPDPVATSLPAAGTLTHDRRGRAVDGVAQDRDRGLAAADGDRGGLVDFRAVLRDEFGRHRELLPQKLYWRAGSSPPGGVAALRERQFEAPTGASGTVLKVELVTPALLMNVVADEVQRHAVALQHDDRGSGTLRRRGRRSTPGLPTGREMSGVTAFACPTIDAAGQPAGLASNVAAVHAFCSVGSREGSCLGQFDFDLRDVRLAAERRGGVGELHGEARAVRPRGLRREVETANLGANFERPRSSSPGTGRTGAARLRCESIVPVISIGLQLVGLNVKFRGR